MRYSFLCICITLFPFTLICYSALRSPFLPFLQKNALVPGMSQDYQDSRKAVQEITAGTEGKMSEGEGERDSDNVDSDTKYGEGSYTHTLTRHTAVHLLEFCPVMDHF